MKIRITYNDKEKGFALGEVLKIKKLFPAAAVKYADQDQERKHIYIAVPEKKNSI